MAFTINGTSGINLATQPLTGVLPDANAPSGSVIQVVNFSSSTQVSTTSTSYVATSYTANITPSSSSNKILVLFNGISLPPTNGEVQLSIYRGATQLSFNLTCGGFNASPWFPNSCQYLDSPSTTSSTTYTIYFRTTNGGTGYITPNVASSNTAQLTLMEVAYA